MKLRLAALIWLMSCGLAVASDRGRLDELFDRLKDAPDPAAAGAIERQINEIWIGSAGNVTAEILLLQAVKALQQGNPAVAIDILDTVIAQNPAYMEALNKRATAYYLTGDYAKSRADIDRVLAAEPRHFGALAGLGMVLEAQGDDRGALAAYRAALRVDPQMDEVRRAADELARRIERAI